MAGSVRQEGWSFDFKVDYSEITKANKLADSLIKKFKSLEQQLKGTSVSNSLPTSLTKVASTTKLASDAAKAYKNDLTKVGQAGEEAGSKAKAKIAVAKDTTQSAATKANELASAYKAVGQSASGITHTSKSLQGASKAARDAKRNADGLHRSIDKGASASDNLRNTGQKVITVVQGIATAAIPLAGIFKKATDEVVDLKNQYSVIRNLMETSGYSNATANKYTREIEKENSKLSTKYGENINGLAKGSETLLRRGYTGAQDVASHEAFLQASRATGESYNDVVNYGASALEQFGYKAKAGNSVKKLRKSTQSVLNQMSYIADVASGSIGGFGESLKVSGSILHGSNQSLSTAVASLGVLSNYGEEGSNAGTGLRKIVTSLIDPSKGAKSAMSHFGLTTSDLYDKNGHMKQLGDIFELFNKGAKAKGLSTKQVNSDLHTIFGQTGYNDASTLIRNYKQVQEYKGKAEGNSSGYTEKLSGKNMGSVKNQLAVTKANLDNVEREFATTLTPAVSTGLKALNKFLKKLADLPSSAKKGIAYTTMGLGAAGAVMVGKNVASNVFGNRGKQLAKALQQSNAGASLPGTGANLPGASIGSKLSTFGKSLYGGKIGSKLGGTATATSGASLLVGAGIAASAGFDIYKAVKSKSGSKARWKNMGKGIGTLIGGGIGGLLGGPAGAAIGATLGKLAGGWAGTMLRKFSKTKLGKSLGKTITSGFSSIKKTVGKTFGSVAALASKSWKHITRDASSMSKRLGADFKTISKILAPVGRLITKIFVTEFSTAFKIAVTVTKTAIRIIGVAIKTVIKVVTDVVDVFTRVVTTINDLVHGRWKKLWGDLKGIVKSELKIVVDVITGIFDTIKNLLGGLGDAVKSLFSGVGKVVSFFTGKKGKGKSSSSHSGHAVSAKAVGGPIQRSQHALVGEEGPELAYTKYGKARILGLNGPQITAVYSGEHILTAKQTAKVLGSGLGRGKVLPGYAQGTGEIIASFAAGASNRQAAGFSSSSLKAWSKVLKETSKETSQTRKNSISDYTTMRKGVLKQVTEISSNSAQTWSKVSKNTDKETSQTRKKSVSDYITMRKGILKQMDAINDGVTDSAKQTASNFGDALGKMKKYAAKAMGDTVDQLNKGISAIDKVLSQFGGNSQVIKPVKFARGSNGKLTHNTIAMVNDATSGPRQEAIVRGGQVFIPRGRNIVLPLQKGDQVLNGTQTQELAHSWGLEHFAKGSGVSKSELRKIAAQGDANPAKAFQSDFTSQIKPSGPKLERGTTGLAKRSSTSYGVPWMKAIWDVIEEAIGSGSGKGGTREAFEKYAEAHFAGKPYLMGSMGPTYYDCSGMVATALRHFGINIGRTTVAMQESSGVTKLGTNIDKATTGDLVIFGHGTGAAGHVGIVKNTKTGTMFNETPPSARVSLISDDTSMGYGYYRVNGLHDAAAKKQSKSNRLQQLAKKELGSTALKWITKNLQEEIASAGSANLVGDQSSKIKELAKLFKKADPNATKAGIAAIIGNWLFESGLNADAVNPSGGASGLGQWLGGRKSSLIAYAKKHGTSWSNAGTQVSFAVSGEGSDSAILRRILEGHGSVASLANAFSSQWERGGYNAQHVAGAQKAASVLGFARGGKPPVGKTVLVGENGPELVKFDGPTTIKNTQETGKKLGTLSQILASLDSKGKTTTVNAKKRVWAGASSAPKVTININGPIGSVSDAKKVAEMIENKLIETFEKIGADFGTDLSIY
ncbi:phage tail tape measure protein [Lactobacillus delbrueckii subsp. bulgaricus]|nr:phage tail tape measure protein [Lactobacillus delbrueckii subsp. bulgaricus]